MSPASQGAGGLSQVMFVPLLGRRKHSSYLTQVGVCGVLWLQDFTTSPPPPLGGTTNALGGGGGGGECSCPGRVGSREESLQDCLPKRPFLILFLPDKNTCLPGFPFVHEIQNIRPGLRQRFSVQAPGPDAEAGHLCPMPSSISYGLCDVRQDT